MKGTFNSSPDVPEYIRAEGMHHATTVPEHFRENIRNCTTKFRDFVLHQLII